MVDKQLTTDSAMPDGITGSLCAAQSGTVFIAVPKPTAS
jgi:hypothetical protein